MKVAAMDESSGKITRRRWLDLAAGSAVAAVGLPAMGKDLANRQSLPPIRQVTHGPKFHWFGYYDKRQFDPTGRYLLSMEVDFEHRSPGPDDVATVGMIDMADGDRWIELGQTSAWCWQQGCMLQWLPGSAGEILWNDRQRDHFVCHILDAKTRAKRTIPHPIYAVSPDGRWAVAPDFSRLHDMRPGYGYAGVPDRYKADLAPKNTGVFRIDLGTGRQELIIRLADVARIPHPRGDLSRMKHYFNHLLVSPDGARFEFFDLWIEAKKMVARMLTAAPDGTDLRMLDPTGNTSHFIWRDPRHILAWSSQPQGDGFYLFQDKPGGSVEQIGKGVMLPEDGHCTYLPGNRRILCDTYPDRQRYQHVYLYDVTRNRSVSLGDFYLPPKYAGEWRCDTHPRYSPDGRSVVIDSPHTGQGRQLHLIDISYLS
ncbi:MAG: hypothetical protein ACLQNE_42460 [Thermoguttaceae bacterium]